MTRKEYVRGPEGNAALFSACATLTERVYSSESCADGFAEALHACSFIAEPASGHVRVYLLAGYHNIEPPLDPLNDQRRAFRAALPLIRPRLLLRYRRRRQT